MRYVRNKKPKKNYSKTGNKKKLFGQSNTKKNYLVTQKRSEKTDVRFVPN